MSSQRASFKIDGDIFEEINIMEFLRFYQYIIIINTNIIISLFTLLYYIQKYCVQELSIQITLGHIRLIHVYK